MPYSRLVLMIVMFAASYMAGAQVKDTLPNPKKVTVVRHYKVNATDQGHADTLLKAYHFDASKQKVDIYFCFEHFQVPHVLPTDNMQTSVAKARECDLQKEPEKAKCYKYDKNGRVTEMHVGGKGFNSAWTYKFNKKQQLVKIEHEEDSYTIEYNGEGNITQVAILNFKVEKRLEFEYE